MDAGEGQHHVYPINSQNEDNNPIKPRKHYIGIEAVSWFINKESNWLSKRMGTATVKVVVNGDEEYNSTLGTFELDNGATIAPIFNKRVLKDRNYRGGGVEFTVNLAMLKRDSALGGLLKSAASSSLDIVSGMVDTASVLGPSKILTAAGGSLVAGVNEMLKNPEAKPSEFFSPYISKYVSGEDIKGLSTYLLFHRGSELDQSQLSIGNRNGMEMPEYNNNELRDGAWVLIKINRSEEYPDVRPWYKARRELKFRIKTLISNVDLGLVQRDNALAEFSFSDTGDKTIADDYSKLRAIIQNDGVLTEVQANLFMIEIALYLKTAKAAIAQEDLTLFEDERDSVANLMAGREPDTELTKVVHEEAPILETIRDEATASTGSIKPSDHLSFIEEFKGSAKIMPNTFKEMKWNPTIA